MKIERIRLPGVVILTPDRFGEGRGFFSESWNLSRLHEAGFDHDCVQDNHSISEVPGTLRGLHFQAPPHAQAKLVRCVRVRVTAAPSANYPTPAERPLNSRLGCAKLTTDVGITLLSWEVGLTSVLKESGALA